jgi:hypothetical protein
MFDKTKTLIIVSTLSFILGTLLISRVFIQHGNKGQQFRMPSLRSLPSRFLADESHRKPRVIKTYRGKSVYLLDEDKVRHHIPDWSTFVALGFDARDISAVSDEEMNSFVEGNQLDRIQATQAHDPSHSCPCTPFFDPAERRNATADQSLNLCVVSSPSGHRVFDTFISGQKKSHHLQIRFVPPTTRQEGISEDLSKSCDVVLDVTSNTTQAYGKYMCPEVCVPVPYTLLAEEWLTNPAHYFHTQQDVPITCSLTWRQLSEELLKKNGVSSKAADVPPSTLSVVRAVVMRRLQECKEEIYWPNLGHSSTISRGILPKRKVGGLIIWVGSRTRYELLEAQAAILRDEVYESTSTATSSSSSSLSPRKMEVDEWVSSNGSTPETIDVVQRVIAGWMASEDQYGCRLGSTLCDDGLIHGTNYYHYGMPQTRLNVANAGWACAQRRPLRALAHALQLYDPDFVLLGDDDTFVSMHVLRSAEFQEYVRTTLARSPLILGQLSQGRKITKRGFYYGGAGYLLSRPALDRLNGYHLFGPKQAGSFFIDFNQMLDLNMLYELGDLANRYCPECVRVADTKASTSTFSTTWQRGQLGLLANSSVRIVDLCVNTMAGEHTCFHSDHSVTRCLAHGVLADILDISCGGTRLSDKLTFGMCMGTAFCNPKVQLTCHRWKPNPDNYLDVPTNLEQSSPSDTSHLDEE